MGREPQYWKSYDQHNSELCLCYCWLLPMQKLFSSRDNQKASVQWGTKTLFLFENSSYLLLAQVVVQHSKQLQNTLLPSGVTQSRVVHHQVWIYFAIVTPYEETPCCRIVFLDDVNAWHEACNPHVVMRMLQQMQEAWMVLPASARFCLTGDMRGA
jgi:hypothetical protein